MRWFAWPWLLWAAGCNAPWPDVTPPSAFDLSCGHAEASCEGCHPANEPLGPVDDACASCHLDERPRSHDPATTATCEDCHEDSCGWDAASPHPGGFDEPEAHGVAFNQQEPTDGKACGACHGADLTGDTATGCDDCHADEGHADWRTDCTFCHGDPAEGSGAPPQDIDDATAPAELSFRSHVPHVNADGDYRAMACTECHADQNDVLTPGHAIDDTPKVAEVDYSRSIAPFTNWTSPTCSDSYCHGGGHRDDGEVSDHDPAPGCDGCHGFEGGFGQMSGYHETHLEERGVVCNDCHAAVIDRDGTIVTAPRHVDGVRDVALFEPGMDRDPAAGTCTGSCHGYDHDGDGWGHVPGYDAPELHGLDANLQASPCGTCHGADWTGSSSAPGCDACHSDEGHADWRTDCNFCHGGANGQRDGLPPQDIDDQSDEASISFGAHPEHDDPGGVGHPAYGCEECHVVPVDALSAGHMIDATPRVAEVDLSAGLSAEGGYDPTSVSCSTMWCHGDGRSPSGVVQDGGGALDCDSCHRTTTQLGQMSGTHQAHVSDGVTCSECHTDVNAQNVITAPNRHVDRNLDLDEAGIGYDPVDRTCTITCHGEPHADFSWDGPHPPGYDAPEQHGQDALFLRDDCTVCHGSDLQGASADGCDRCHTAAWREDCTYCHGGAGGDSVGLPPTDLDDESNEARISFKAHPEHSDNDEHPAWGCDTCHGTASRTYTDAWTDANHWVDSTVGVAEVRFTGDAAGTTYGGGNCTTSYCHGNGQVNGESTDGTTPLDCNGCHAYDLNRGDLSGTHPLHLQESGVTCADCHAPVVNAAGVVTTPDRHVDRTIDVNAASTGWSAATETCTITCHNHPHTNMSWLGGHPAGYDDPDVHGQEALFQVQDCTTAGCHGTDLQGGGSGQGCDSCHTANWRRDCVFCHGGVSDQTGAPPEDLDNTTVEAQLSFDAHPEHADNNTHPVYGCEECHGTASAAFTDALTDNGHWWDATPGVSEVAFGGLGSGASYAASTATCSNLYCHGDGQSNGSETDSGTALTCRGCHPDSGSTENAIDGMSGKHKKHVWDENSPCSDCHYAVVRNGQNMFDADLHVNGIVDVQLAPTTNMTWNGNTCSGGPCHGDNHNGERW